MPSPQLGLPDGSVRKPLPHNPTTPSCSHPSSVMVVGDLGCEALGGGPAQQRQTGALWGTLSSFKWKNTGLHGACPKALDWVRLSDVVRDPGPLPLTPCCGLCWACCLLVPGWALQLQESQLPTTVFREGRERAREENLFQKPHAVLPFQLTG